MWRAFSLAAFALGCASAPPPQPTRDLLLWRLQCAHAAFVTWGDVARKKIDAACIAAGPDACAALQNELSVLIAQIESRVRVAYSAIESKLPIEDASLKTVAAVLAVAASGAPLEACAASESK